MPIIFLLFALGFVSSAHSISFPVMTHAAITTCGSGGVGECSRQVWYSGTSAIVDIGQPITQPLDYKAIDTWGIHCDVGNALTGVRFTKCLWDHSSTHAPTMTNCNLAGRGWELALGSTCATSPTWGGHNGAAPGGECVMFGQLNYGARLLRTPMGDMDAETVANAGNRFCIKPLPPSVRCDVNLPPTIDHGMMGLGTFDQKYVEGAVNCGSKPVVAIVGQSRIELTPGVVTNITATMQSASLLRVQSDMTVETSAKPGKYSGSIIVTVSPY